MRSTHLDIHLGRLLSSSSSSSSMGEAVPSSVDQLSRGGESAEVVRFRSDSPVIEPRSSPCCRENKRQSRSTADFRVLDATPTEALAAGRKSDCTPRSLDRNADASRRDAVSWSARSALAWARPSMYSFRFFRESFAEYLFFTCRRSRLSSRSDALDSGPFLGTVIPSCSIRPRSSSVKMSKNEPDRAAAVAAAAAWAAAGACLRAVGLGEAREAPPSRFTFLPARPDGLTTGVCSAASAASIGSAFGTRRDGSSVSTMGSSAKRLMSSESMECSETSGDVERRRRFSNSTSEPEDQSGDHSVNQDGSTPASSTGMSQIRLSPNRVASIFSPAFAALSLYFSAQLFSLKSCL
eukprot:m.132757 g.132757  ORF g.132757 m.132757 type:complete len:352 (-) comp22469_c1_seq1:893-1948(-)